MNSPTLTADQHRDIRDSVPKLRRRLAELYDAFQQDHLRSALGELYVRSADTQRIEFDSLTGDEAALLLLCLEQTVTRQLVADLEQLDLNQQNAACN